MITLYNRLVHNQGAGQQTDQIVSWTKPATCPTYLSREVWAKLPEEVTVREVRYCVETAGYRTREVTLVTTLLDVQMFSSESLAELYLLRWRIELNFRDLKTTMGLEVLKCKTVQGVLKELTIFALIYNLVMRLRFHVALAIGLCPVTCPRIMYQSVVESYQRVLSCLAEA